MSQNAKPQGRFRTPKVESLIFYNTTSRIVWNTVRTSRTSDVAAGRRLRRVSTVGSQIGRRSVELDEGIADTWLWGKLCRSWTETGCFRWVYAQM